MIGRIGLIFFILGCFGCLNEVVKPSNWSGWTLVAEIVLIIGACLYIFCQNKED